MKDIDGLLKNYDPGLPNMKPDVLKQIKELEAEREKMVKELADKQNGPIMMNIPGQAPKQLSNPEVVQLIQQQQQAIQQFTNERQGMQNNLLSMQNQIIQASIKIQELEEEIKKLKSKEINETVFQVDSEENIKMTRIVPEIIEEVISI